MRSIALSSLLSPGRSHVQDAITHNRSRQKPPNVTLPRNKVRWIDQVATLVASRRRITPRERLRSGNPVNRTRREYSEPILASDAPRLCGGRFFLLQRQYLKRSLLLAALYSEGHRRANARSLAAQCMVEVGVQMLGGRFLGRLQPDNPAQNYSLEDRSDFLQTRWLTERLSRKAATRFVREHPMQEPPHRAPRG